MDEFSKLARKRQDELMALKNEKVHLEWQDEKILGAVDKRLKAIARSEKNEEATLEQLLRFMNARLMKPQRLVSLTFEEEERRALRGWWRFDWKLNVACFRPLEELGALVRKPDLFREKVRELVVYMADQIPMWLKIKPGAQVYAEFEIRNGTHERNLGSLSGGGSQAASTMLRDDDEDEIQSGMEGMTQLRGEASKDQDKFRITVEREQRCLGSCDDHIICNM